MIRKLTLFVLTFVLIVGMPTAVFAHHYGFKYSAPTLSSLSVVGCTAFDGASVKVTWKRTGPYTSVQWGFGSGFNTGGNTWNPWEFGTRDEVRYDTSATIKHVRPGRRIYFRVFASEYGGHRLSKYSNVRSIVTPAC